MSGAADDNSLAGDAVMKHNQGASLPARQGPDGLYHRRMVYLFD